MRIRQITKKPLKIGTEHEIETHNNKIAVCVVTKVEQLNVGKYLVESEVERTKELEASYDC
jgi:hypothetical protein